MARGWESKAVESQMESAQTRRPRSRQGTKTPDQLRREKERESIELTRIRVLHDLGAATHPRHRAQLEAALSHIEKQIAGLTDSTEPA